MKFNVHCKGRKVRVESIRILLLGLPWLEELTYDEAEEITQWVTENKLGRRVAYDMWQLNSNKAVTVFMLRYG